MGTTSRRTSNNVTSDEEEFIPYSKEELAEFEKIIMEKRDQALKDIEALKSLYRNDAGNGTDDTSPANKAYDEGSENNNKESHAINAARLEKYVVDLDNALTRIKNNVFGKCRITEKRIPKPRLRLVPHTTLSIEGKEFLDRKEKGIYK